jgi:hypothetical protein
MATKVYGASDDLIEVDGDLRGECSAYGTDDNTRGALVIFDDGTILEVKYCGRISGVWEIKALQRGTLFEKIEQQDNDEAEIYSDIAYFKDGIKRAYFTKEWSPVE